MVKRKSPSAKAKKAIVKRMVRDAKSPSGDFIKDCIAFAT